MKSKVKMFPVINDMLPFSEFADIERGGVEPWLHLSWPV